MSVEHIVKLVQDCDIERIGTIIGQGSYGVVSLVKYKSYAAAMKVFKEHGRADAIHEINLLAKLHHVNIMGFIGIVSDADDAPEEINYLLEYCDRGSLFDVVSKSTIDEDTAVKFATDIATGMLYLHDLNIIHRDLAARNVLVKQNTAKISDFGFSITRDTSIKPLYKYRTAETLRIPVRHSPKESVQALLPEKKRSYYGKASDVWSYGVLLWEIKTNGRLPYEGLENVASYIDSGNNPNDNFLAMGPGLIKTIMTLCLQTEAALRPSFIRIIGTIQDYHSNENPGASLHESDSNSDWTPPNFPEFDKDVRVTDDWGSLGRYRRKRLASESDTNSWLAMEVEPAPVVTKVAEPVEMESLQTQMQSWKLAMERMEIFFHNVPEEGVDESYVIGKAIASANVPASNLTWKRVRPRFSWLNSLGDLEWRKRRNLKEPAPLRVKFKAKTDKKRNRKLVLKAIRESDICKELKLTVTESMNVEDDRNN